MKGGVSPIAVAKIRERLQARVEASSIRALAREVGLPPNGLDYFLKGGEPRSATRRKLEAWFVRDAAAGAEALDAETAGAALEVLLRVVPPAGRDVARERLMSALREACGPALPTWLHQEP